MTTTTATQDEFILDNEEPVSKSSVVGSTDAHAPIAAAVQVKTELRRHKKQRQQQKKPIAPPTEEAKKQQISTACKKKKKHHPTLIFALAGVPVLPVATRDRKKVHIKYILRSVSISVRRGGDGRDDENTLSLSLQCFENYILGGICCISGTISHQQRVKAIRFVTSC
jgi:hypothetical protein